MKRPLTLIALALAALHAGCTNSERPVNRGAGRVDPEPLDPFATPPSSAPTDPSPTNGFAPSVFPSPTSAPTAPTAMTAPTCAGIAMAPPPPMMPRAPIVLPGGASATVPPRPISGGTLLILRDGGAAVADPDRDVVSIVDLSERRVRARARLVAGDEPGRLVEDAAGRVHVVLRSGGAIATIDPATGMLVRRTSVCAAPRGLAYDASPGFLHVACADGRLLTLDAATGTVRRSVLLQRDLRDVVVLGDGRLVVSTFRNADAFIVATDGTLVERQRPATSQRQGPSGLQAMSPSVAWRLAPTPGGGAVMLHQRGVDDEVNPTAGGYGVGPLCSSIVESAVTVVAPGQASTAAPGLPLAALAVDIAVSPDGREAAVASAGNAGTTLPQITVTDLGVAPGTSCATPRPTPMNVADTQVVSLAYRADGTLVAQSREPAALLFADGGRVSLAADSLADTGHTLFHINAGGGIACASCHPEGGEDGRTWKFSCLGPRRTQSMRGGLSGTEPFHWDGDMRDFSTLVHTVFEGRMSGPALAAPQSSALLRWIDSIPTLPNPSAKTAAVAHGDALFHDATVGCNVCHAGAKLTNNQTVDMGLGLPTQVPSLRGVVWRAPFLHTGCAATLRERFSPACGGGDKHGHTSQLAANELDDLVTYLETL